MSFIWKYFPVSSPRSYERLGRWSLGIHVAGSIHEVSQLLNHLKHGTIEFTRPHSILGQGFDVHRDVLNAIPFVGLDEREPEANAAEFEDLP